MKKIVLLAMLLSVFVFSNAYAPPGTMECYPSQIYLVDYFGNLLEDGDYVCVVWSGPDEVIDPPATWGEIGMPTGDDVLASDWMIESGSFFIPLIVWNIGDLDSLGNQRRPTQGDRVYCRIFDGKKVDLNASNYYGDSNLCIVWDGSSCHFTFPGSADTGRTDTPLTPETLVTSTSLKQVATDFILGQNYPNPFNPATEIAYAISRDVHVILKIYNVLGAEVATLLDDDQQAGFYTVPWDAGDLAGGVYFCTMTAGDFRAAKKMVLLK